VLSSVPQGLIVGVLIRYACTMALRNRDKLFNVYSYREEDAQYKIIPIVKSGSTEWELRVFRDNQQGPVFTGRELTEEIIEKYDLPHIGEGKVAGINECIEYANQFLEYDSEYNRKERGEADIKRLYLLTSMGGLKDRIEGPL